MEYTLINGIKCSGIASSLPSNIKYFSDSIINSRIIIKSKKPSIDTILSIVANSRVGNIEIIDTPVKVCRDGKVLSGKKIIVELIINTQIKYRAINFGPNICIEECNIIKTVSIVVPEIIDGQKINELIRRKRYGVTSYIEDILGERINERELGVTISILTNIDFISDNNFNIENYMEL